MLKALSSESPSQNLKNIETCLREYENIFGYVLYK